MVCDAIDKLIELGSTPGGQPHEATEANLLEAEAILVRRLHPHHRELLLRAGTIVYGAYDICSIHDPLDIANSKLVLSTRECWERGVPDGFVAVVDDDDSVQYCMSPEGLIVEWDFGANARTWTSLEAFIRADWLDE